jgi:O-antigen ligase
MTGAIEKRLNLHNQFLETWLSLGMIGILYLIFLLVYPAYLAWKNKKISWLLFIIAVSLNFLFETMLNTQAGVIFISYFYYFFFIELKTEVK